MSYRTLAKFLALLVVLLMIQGTTLYASPKLLASQEIGAAAQSTSCATVTEIPRDECNALVALYTATGGAGWISNDGWLTSMPCTWYGVVCTNGRVSSLLLAENNLQGPLPTDIAQLSALQVLDLSHNTLTGSLPVQLGLYPGLTRLDLSYNTLNSPIVLPVGSKATLRELNLAHNQLWGVLPAELGGFGQLERVDLSFNILGGSIPADWGNFARLQTLDLSHNLIAGSITPELGQLATLTSLNLSTNRLTGSIPTALGGLGALQTLDLSSNRLTGAIPAALGNLTSLRHLALARNALSGAVPAALTALVGLQAQGSSTDLGYNALSSSDLTVTAFLNQVDPDWAATQTLPPTNVAVSVGESSGLTLRWNPIPYTADGGFYEIRVAVSARGPFLLYAQTADKSTASYTIPWLSPGHTYYVTIRSFTPAHDAQQNELWSSESIGITGQATACHPDAKPSDINCDLVVNTTDVMRVVADWRLPVVAGDRRDLNSNGSIDLLDVMRIAADWSG